MRFWFKWQVKSVMREKFRVNFECRSYFDRIRCHNAYKTFQADEVREDMNTWHYDHTFLNVITIIWKTVWFLFLCTFIFFCNVGNPWWPNVSGLRPLLGVLTSDRINNLCISFWSNKLPSIYVWNYVSENVLKLHSSLGPRNPFVMRFSCFIFGTRDIKRWFAMYRFFGEWIHHFLDLRVLRQMPTQL